MTGALGLAVGLIVLELGVRLIAPQATRFFSWEDFCRPDGSLEPGRRGSLWGVPVEINAYGERGPPYSREKAAGTFRICVIGDSIVFGLGVHDTKRYPRLLEQLLREKLGDGSVEVIPFSQIAYPLSAYRERLLPKALEFDPDLVLVGFVLNDFERPPKTESRSRWSDEPQTRRGGLLGIVANITAKLRKHSHLVYLVRKQAQILLWGTFLSKPELIHRWGFECMYPDSEEYETRWAHTVEQLDQLHATCQNRGVQLAIVVAPFDNQLNADRLRCYRQYIDDLPDTCLDAIPQRMLGQYASSRSIAFVDATPRFKEHAGKVFFEMFEGCIDPCHPNAEGHRIMAEMLADRLAPVVDLQRGADTEIDRQPDSSDSNARNP